MGIAVEMLVKVDRDINMSATSLREEKLTIALSVQCRWSIAVFRF